ncbi:hypothetical protein EVG20_g3887 [Dentipellis fragilis]|uniref:Uncharacterized protein n=1 Tax=Dentipellis fragilis TaxID=205917 RepID=A0A4Y9YYY7_9AGAM|nr:hypothetical protein EVG20_g3887 [Dentipellis fragilis]
MMGEHTAAPPSSIVNDPLGMAMENLTLQTSSPGAAPEQDNAPRRTSRPARTAKAPLLLPDYARNSFSSLEVFSYRLGCV